jgi:ABC-type thiamine transport system ATPase subunit
MHNFQLLLTALALCLDAHQYRTREAATRALVRIQPHYDLSGPLARLGSRGSAEVGYRVRRILQETKDTVVLSPVGP